MEKTLGMVSFVLFCIGLVITIIAGFIAPTNPIVYAILAIFGLVIGIIYAMYTKEIGGLHTLLLSTIALLAMAAALAPITNLWSGTAVTGIITNFAALMAPVALIAAIKALLSIGLEHKVKM